MSPAITTGRRNFSADSTTNSKTSRELTSEIRVALFDRPAFPSRVPRRRSGNEVPRELRHGSLGLFGPIPVRKIASVRAAKAVTESWRVRSLPKSIRWLSVAFENFRTRLRSLFRQDMEPFQLVEALPELQIAKTNLFLPAGEMTHRLKDLSRQITFANLCIES